MADTVKLFGSNIPKPVVIGGGVIAFAASAYFYRTKKQANDAQASIDAAGSTNIDPATGYPYGSPEDAASLGNQDNYSLPGGAGGGYGYTGYAGGSGGGVFGTGAPGSFNSNAEWAQYVEGYEVNNMGGDAPTVGNAIGKYLTGQALSTEQIALVQSAIAIAGYPPVSGPNGNPPNYITATTGDTNPPGNGGGTTPPPGGNKYASNPPKGLHVVFAGKDGGQIQWNPVNGATSYTVYTPTRTVKKFNTTNTIANIGSLKPNTSYQVQVWANPTPTGGPHATTTIHTTK